MSHCASLMIATIRLQDSSHRLRYPGKDLFIKAGTMYPFKIKGCNIWRPEGPSIRHKAGAGRGISTVGAHLP
jgi:hypothetical protein